METRPTTWLARSARFTFFILLATALTKMSTAVSLLPESEALFSRSKSGVRRIDPDARIGFVERKKPAMTEDPFSEIERRYGFEFAFPDFDRDPSTAQTAKPLP